MKKYNNMAIALVLLGMLASVTALAESSEPFPEEDWNRTYRNAGNASAYSVQETADGGYLISGSTCSYEPWQCSPWLLRTDADGNEQWNKTFSSEYGTRSILQTRDGGYIFADRSLVKVDLNGNEQWAKTIGEGTIFSVRGTSDGGYIGAGIIPEAPGSNHPNGWLIKVDANGDEQWNSTFLGMGFCMIESVQQTGDGGYVLAGYRTGREELGGSWLIKTDADGNELWNRTFGPWNRTFGGRGEWANSVQQTTDGGYILAGRGFLLIKTDANGNMLWGKNKKFKGKEIADAHSALQTPDGGYIIAGDAYSTGGSNMDSWLMKADENGNEQWNMTFVGEQNSEAYSVRQTKDGSYIIAGTTFFSTGGSYAWLRKVGGEQTGTAKTQASSQTETPIAHATVPVSPPELRFVWEPGDNLTFTWKPANFDGFYYDPENRAGNESLTIRLDKSKKRSIQPNGIVYFTTVTTATARYKPFGEYAVIGFIGEKYLAGFPEGKSNITNNSGINLRPLHKILIDENDSHTLDRGNSLTLDEGYVIETKDVNLIGASVTLILKKNGVAVDEKTVSTGKNYIYEIQYRPVVAVHVDSVLERNGTVFAGINGIFQVSEYHTPVNQGDIFGVMKIINVSDRSITMRNTLDTMDLKRVALSK